MFKIKIRVGKILSLKASDKENTKIQIPKTNENNKTTDNTLDTNII
jgi:hypothetical protein